MINALMADMIEKLVTETPWGRWEIMETQESYQVKKLIIKPLQRLSYQKHSRREENWFIVQGLAEFTLNDKITHLKEGDFVHIPIEATHRIKNTSADTDLIFIEIQRGTYFGEDDIERFADDYGRR